MRPVTFDLYGLEITLVHDQFPGDPTGMDRMVTIDGLDTLGRTLGQTIIFGTMCARDCGGIESCIERCGFFPNGYHAQVLRVLWAWVNPTGKTVLQPDDPAQLSVQGVRFALCGLDALRRVARGTWSIDSPADVDFIDTATMYGLAFGCEERGVHVLTALGAAVALAPAEVVADMEAEAGASC